MSDIKNDPNYALLDETARAYVDMLLNKTESKAAQNIAALIVKMAGEIAQRELQIHNLCRTATLMRNKQKAFFQGDKHAIKEAKQHEATFDAYLKTKGKSLNELLL